MPAAHVPGAVLQTLGGLLQVIPEHGSATHVPLPLHIPPEHAVLLEAFP